MNDNRTSQCECSNPKHPNARACDRCNDLEQDRLRGDTRRRVMSALSRFDWVSALDLCIALDIGVESGPEWVRVQSMLYRFRKDGLVETRGLNSGMEYRLVQRKRRAA